MDEVIFVGTGVSTGIPIIGHLGDGCACKDALQSLHSKNRRNNVSLLIRRRRQPGAKTIPPPKPRSASGGGAKEPQSPNSEKKDSEKNDDEEQRKDQVGLVMGDTPQTAHEAFHNVLIDVGKTFRDAYFRTMAPEGVATLDAILITHDHADAMAGLDDVRDLQSFHVDGEVFKCLYYVPCYLASSTLRLLEKQAGYIVDNSVKSGPHDAVVSEEEIAAREAKKKSILKRRVTCLDLIEVSELEVEPFSVIGLEGVPVYTVPVFHGGLYRCLGYAFGNGIGLKDREYTPEELNKQDKGKCIVYLSDISEMPKDSMAFLKRLKKIDILIIDVLLGPYQTHFSHFCVDQAWDLIVELQPTKAYGIGMYCELEHEATNTIFSERLEKLRQSSSSEGASPCSIESVELAYDGLKLPMHL